MFRVIAFLGAFIVVSVTDASNLRSAAVSAPRVTDSLCLDSIAGTGVDLAYFKTMGSSTSPPDTIIRHGLLPLVTSADVSFVRDTSLCRRAAESLRRMRFGADTGLLVPLELFHYGSMRFLASPPVRTGEFNAWSVFDTTFTHLGVILQ